MSTYHRSPLGYELPHSELLLLLLLSLLLLFTLAEKLNSWDPSHWEAPRPDTITDAMVFL